MANQRQGHIVEPAHPHGTGMRLRDAPSIRKSKRSRDDSILDISVDVEFNGKLTRENDAAALLLGLAHSVGSPTSLKDSGDLLERDKAPYRSEGSKDKLAKIRESDESRACKSPQIDHRVMKLLTAKGHGRLGPGDNRVRPPKAATKLLNAKWRHIRLPNIQAALEAEDWVVMYSHLIDPGSLSKDKMITMLNFHPSHYDQQDVKQGLESLQNANELENFLKDRYCGGIPKKNRSTQRSLPVRTLARNEFHNITRNLTGFSTMANMKYNSNGSEKFPSLEAVKSGVPLLTSRFIQTHRKESDQNSEGENIMTPPSMNSGDSKLVSKLADGQSISMHGYGGLPWPMLQNPSTVTDVSKTRELWKNSSEDHKSLAKRPGSHSPIQLSKSVNFQSEDIGMKIDSTSRPKVQRSKIFNSQSPRDNTGMNSDDSHHYSTEAAGIYKPGRPPSYDAMVKWCVDLKRILFQKKVNLTIDEAVALVNDPAVYACGPRTAHTKSLVASTLRKRVLGIYGITWSQVATSFDKDVNKEINDKDILFAATNMLNRHGLNLNGRLVSLGDDKGKPFVILEQKNNMGGPSKEQASDERISQLEHGIEQDVSEHAVNPDDNIHVMNTRLHANLAGISETTRKIIKKAEIQFLSFEEVALIIKDASEGKLPISLQVNYRPQSGTLYLINRSKVAKFRCDGYDFKKRETHARKMISNNERLNCYYAGGTKDNMQRRCYWLISEDSERLSSHSSTQPKDLVLIHYMKNCAWTELPNADLIGESFPSKEKLMRQKEELEQKIAELNHLLSR